MLFRSLTIQPAGQARVFGPIVGSFRRISDREAASISPRRGEVVTVRRGDTVASLGSKMAVESLPVERFAALNALAVGEAPRPGRRVKLITNASR